MWRAHRVGRSLCVSLVALTVGSPFSVAPRARGAEPAPEKVSPLLIPGGVADPDGKIAYVANPKGGLDVLRLATGELLWTVPGIRRPLVVAAGRLIVEVPVKDHPQQFALAVYDATQAGARLIESDPQSFPEWVSIDSDLANSFATECQVAGDVLSLRWRADFSEVSDDKLLPAARDAQRKAASGEIRMDLKTGKSAARLDDKPTELTGQTESRDTTIGGCRLLLDEAAEAGVGFSRDIKRTLRATDSKSGKILWQRAVAPEVVISPPR